MSIFRTGLATGCRRNAEIGIGLVRLFKAFSKSGFSGKNAPKNKKDKSIPEDEVDWSFKLSNEAIREITKMTEIKTFVTCST